MGYSYLDTKDRSSGTDKQELQYRPRHKVTFEGKYTFDFGFSVYLNVLHVADQVYYSRKTTPLIKAWLNDFTLVNMRFSQEFLRRHLALYVGVDNLFDEDYEESYGFPQPGRYVYGGMKFRF